MVTAMPETRRAFRRLWLNLCILVIVSRQAVINRRALRHLEAYERLDDKDMELERKYWKLYTEAQTLKPKSETEK